MGRCLHPLERRGYFGVCFLRPKYQGNVGAIMRSAFNFGAKFMVIVGARYERESSDTVNIADKLPIVRLVNEAALIAWAPPELRFVSMELTPEARALPSYDHPKMALYVVGPEDGNVPADVLALGEAIQIPGSGVLNASIAASIVLYDRIAKRARLYRRQVVDKIELEVR